MLSKTQKIWLCIFGAMFTVPEILWGDLLKIFKISLLPIYKDTQLFNDKPNLAFLIIVIEIIGISGITYLFNKSNLKNIIFLKYISNIFLVVVLLILLLSLFLSYSINQINFL